METPDDTSWDNEWQEIPGPEAILISVVHNPRAAAAAGQDARRDRQAVEARIRSTRIFDLLIEDDAFTMVAVFGMSEPDVALALQQPWVSINNDSQGTAPEGLLGQEHPHPRAYGTFPRILRKFVREEQAADAGGCHPQVQRAARAAHAPGRSRRAEAGHVGRRGGVRSGRRSAT